MSDLNEILDPFERIVWQGKAHKYTYFFPAIASILFGGLLFSIGVFLFFITETFFLMPLMFGFFGTFIAVIPFFYYLRKNKNTKYVLTEKRLIITGFGKNSRFWDNFGFMFPGIDTTTMKLDTIKDVYLKKKFSDRIFKTRSIYPISLDYPYLPKTYVYVSKSEHESGIHSSRKKRVYNAATKEYEMVPQFLLHRKTKHHPHFEGIKEWDKVEKLIRDRIIIQKSKNHKTNDNYSFNRIKEPKVSNKRYFLLIFIIIGIGGLIASAYMTFNTFTFLDRAQVTEAIVVDFVKVRDSDGWNYYPIYQFVDLNGVEVYARGTWNIDVNIGENVEIYYDPENPTENVYAGGLAVWGPPLLLFGFGISFAGIGSFMFFKGE